MMVLLCSGVPLSTPDRQIEAERLAGKHFENDAPNSAATHRLCKSHFPESSSATENLNIGG